MVTQSQVQVSKAVQQATGPTFHLATRFLPERIREPTYVLYAFFRRADDVVDDPDPAPPAGQRRRIEEIRAAVLGERSTDDPVLRATDAIRRDYDIPRHEFEVFLDAMAADIEPTGYDTPAEQRDYLRGSAVAVANMMLSVMTPPDPKAAREPAAALGEAFQLTNFLRDVGEDIDKYGRIYIPESVLKNHGVSRAELRAKNVNAGFVDAMQAELERTERRYHRGVTGIDLLPQDCRFPVLLAATLYAEHHRLIRRRDFDVLSDTPSIGSGRYIRILAETAYHWWRTGDPEETFYRVSPIDPPADWSPTTTEGLGRYKSALHARITAAWN